MSYKFQRLRETIREAITSGELQGKLPGERALGQRFNANAKTLSKALTDLAAEGVLERVIGRGTFVKGQVPAPAQLGRWLYLTDPQDPQPSLVAALSAINPDCEAISAVSDLRPSFLNHFSAVIDLSCSTPEPFLRELTVRNIPIVLVNREPATFSLHAVLVDVALAGARLGREMVLAGHRHFAAIEHAGSSVLTRAMRQATSRVADDAVVETCQAGELMALVESGTTAVVCATPASAEKARAALQEAGNGIAGRVSLAAVGCTEAPWPCSGYFVEPAELAEAAAGLLRDCPSTRPAVLWIAGTWRDADTIHPGDQANLPSQSDPTGLGIATHHPTN